MKASGFLGNGRFYRGNYILSRRMIGESVHNINPKILMIRCMGSIKATDCVIDDGFPVYNSMCKQKFKGNIFCNVILGRANI